MSARIDVVVVGAGMAGLAAGRLLAGAGLRVTLIEARNRVGGRIHTHHLAPDIPIELGAEFIHGQPPALWTLIREARLPRSISRGSTRMSPAIGEPSTQRFNPVHWLPGACFGRGSANVLQADLPALLQLGSRSVLML